MKRHLSRVRGFGSWALFTLYLHAHGILLTLLSEDSRLHLLASPLSSWAMWHLSCPLWWTPTPPCPSTCVSVTTFNMNHHKRCPILDITWIGKTSHQMSVPTSQFLFGEPPRIPVLPGLGFAFLPLSPLSLLGFRSYPFIPTEIPPLDYHFILTSCHPQGCMFSSRHTFSCYRGTCSFLLQGYSCSVCYSLGLEYSLFPFQLLTPFLKLWFNYHVLLYLPLTSQFNSFIYLFETEGDRKRQRERTWEGEGKGEADPQVPGIMAYAKSRCLTIWDTQAPQHLNSWSNVFPLKFHHPVPLLSQSSSHYNDIAFLFAHSPS